MYVACVEHILSNTCVSVGQAAGMGWTVHGWRQEISLLSIPESPKSVSYALTVQTRSGCQWLHSQKIRVKLLCHPPLPSSMHTE